MLDAEQLRIWATRLTTGESPLLVAREMENIAYDMEHDWEPPEGFHDTLKEIEGHAEKDDIIAQLDDLVSDVVSGDASAINNSGVEEQLQYLVQTNMPLGEVREAIGVDIGR